MREIGHLIVSIHVRVGKRPILCCFTQALDEKMEMLAGKMESFDRQFKVRSSVF